MSYKLYDWECTNTDCIFFKMSCEVLAADNEDILCSECKKSMTKQMPAPKGYVSKFCATRFRKATKRK